MHNEEIARPEPGKASSPSEEVSGCGTTDHEVKYSEWGKRSPTSESDGTAQTIGEVLANLKAGTPLAEVIATAQKKRADARSSSSERQQNASSERTTRTDPAVSAGDAPEGDSA